jgi:tetratricopeptide (TPR) repeat protein
MKKTIIIIVMLVLAAPAFAESLLKQYSDAVKLARQGQSEQAISLLKSLYRDHPEDKLADDILFQIGRIYEKRLGAYGESIEYYRKLTEEFPRSKHARRAEKAIERLQKGRRQGDDVFREYNDILLNYREIGGEQALERMEKLIQNKPNFIYAEKVFLFIAQEKLRSRDFTGVVAAYEQMIKRFPSGRNKIIALSGMGEALIEARDFSGAKKAYRRLMEDDENNEPAMAAGREGVKRVNTFLVLRYLFFCSIAIIIAFLIFMAAAIPWKKINKKMVFSIWPEVSVLTLGIFGILISLRDRGDIFTTSIFWLWPSAIIVALCNNLYIQSRKMSKYSALLGVGAVICVSLATAYAIYYSTDLANLLWDALIYEMGRRWR